MTLSGLALAVGILVDDATVTIENINRHLDLGQDIETAIVSGAREIMIPATVSLTCICTAFSPMFFLGGIAGYLFRPLAEAVIFALIASYILTYTLVPTLANRLLRRPAAAGRGGRPSEPQPAGALPEGLRASLRGGPPDLPRRAATGSAESPRADRRIPRVRRPFDGAHAPARPGLLSAGRRRPDQAPPAGPDRDADRGDHPAFQPGRPGDPQDRSGRSAGRVVSNIGVSVSGINMAYNNSGTISTADADILITLAAKHAPTADYVRELRKTLRSSSRASPSPSCRRTWSPRS